MDETTIYRLLYTQAGKVVVLGHGDKTAGLLNHDYAAGILGKLNAHDALVAACRAALSLLTGTGQDGTLGHHPDNPVPAQLRAALAEVES